MVWKLTKVNKDKLIPDEEVVDDQSWKKFKSKVLIAEMNIHSKKYGQVVCLDA